MNLQEYEDLTSKLNEFQMQEQKLLEQIGNDCDGRDSPEYLDDNDEAKLYSDTFLTKMQNSNQGFSSNIGKLIKFHFFEVAQIIFVVMVNILYYHSQE